MKILIQMGNKGNSVVDHLTQPIARAEIVDRLIIVSRYPGPQIRKTEYHTPPKAIADIPPLAVLFEFLRLLSLSKSQEPDCVIGQKLFPHALIAFLVSKMTRRPLIISLIAGPIELFSTGSPVGTDFHKALPLKGRFFLRILRQANAVITTGSFTKEFLVKHGLPRERIHAIIHMPDSSLYHPININKEYDVVAVGRLASVKNTETLLRAISRVKGKREDVRICIVGDGPCRDELVRLASTLGINENVEFAGFRRNVIDYYNRAQMFVLTSEREGFPNVLLEAMMCGLPSVTSDCGDVKDIAVDGQTSIVISNHTDDESYAQAILHLLDDHTLRERLSINAMKATEEYSRERATQKWEKILGEVNDSRQQDS